MDILVKKVGEDSGRKPTPSYELVDPQTAKTTSASDDREFDGGKKSRDVNDT